MQCTHTHKLKFDTFACLQCIARVYCVGFSKTSANPVFLKPFEMVIFSICTAYCFWYTKGFRNEDLKLFHGELTAYEPLVGISHLEMMLLK